MLSVVYIPPRMCSRLVNQRYESCTFFVYVLCWRNVKAVKYVCNSKQHYCTVLHFNLYHVQGYVKSLVIVWIPPEPDLFDVVQPFHWRTWLYPWNPYFCKIIIWLNKYFKSPQFCSHQHQGIGIKEKEMALVWNEKASRTALQTSSVNLTHTRLVQTHTHDVSAPWSTYA